MAIFEFDEKKNAFFISEAASKDYFLDRSRLGDGGLHSVIATALAFTLGGKFDEARLRAGAVGMHVSEEIQEKWINARK